MQQEIKVEQTTTELKHSGHQVKLCKADFDLVKYLKSVIQRDSKRADERIFALDELVHQQYKADLASSQKEVDQIRRERDAAKQQVEERVVALRELKLQLKQYKIEMKLSQTQRDQALHSREGCSKTDSKSKRQWWNWSS